MQLKTAKIFHYFIKAFNKIVDIYQQKKHFNALVKIRKEVELLTNNKTFGIKPKVLFASFSIYPPCFTHDFLLSQSLILRGAEIIPVICGKVQECECNVFGGIWGGYTGDPEKDKEQSIKNCDYCQKSDLSLWNKTSNINALVLNDYISPQEKETLSQELITAFDKKNYKEWHYDDMPVGQWIVDIIRNNALVGDEKLVKNYDKYLYHYLKNIVFLIASYKKILNEIRPDFIVSNDSFYYQWAILEKLAVRNNIPFYSQWSGTRKKGWCYSLNGPAMALDFDKVWTAFKKVKLSADELRTIDEFLEGRKSGNAMVLNTADPGKNSDELEEFVNIDFNKPTALLASNVIWDLAALNKDIQFNGMIDWVNRVIEFFRQNPQWQLIIKAHPAEQNKYIPETAQKLFDEINKHGKLPSNVYFLGPKSKTNVYELLPRIKLGLVYTTTVGLEMACNGIPVITSGKSPYYAKGLTFDTANKNEYFAQIKSLLEQGLSDDEKSKLKTSAKKFFFLYFYIYFTSLNLFDYSLIENPKLLISGAEDLLPGKNVVLDYICDSVLKGQPIVSENRWPPFVN